MNPIKEVKIITKAISVKICRAMHLNISIIPVTFTWPRNIFSPSHCVHHLQAVK